MEGRALVMLARIGNEARTYAWGLPGGISELLAMPQNEGTEAELWLGAHPLSPSRVLTPVGFSSLMEWETSSGRVLPFLFKVLAAAEPLSLQVHPAHDQARGGFEREQTIGVPLGEPRRNYKDPHAKPELIVAVRDGFEALCGFRAVEDVRRDLARLGVLAEESEPIEHLSALVAVADIAPAVEWMLSGEPLAIRLIVVLREVLSQVPGEFTVARRLLKRYPTDPGVAVSLMLNHVVLNAGEALWLAPGTIHAYLCGIGIELMGPSDNVLRGGLTVKHVDVPELLSVLDFSSGPPPRLHPVQEGEFVRAYLPSTLPSGQGVDFWLREVTGPCELRTAGPAILLVLEGEYLVEAHGAAETARRGDALFCPEAGVLSFAGEGRAFVAAT